MLFGKLSGIYPPIDQKIKEAMRQDPQPFEGLIPNSGVDVEYETMTDNPPPVG